MKLSFLIDSKPLMAARHFVSKDPLRFRLNGVLAEIEEHRVTFVATCGRTLFACQANHEAMEGFEGKTQVIIPMSLLRYVKPKKSDPRIWIKVNCGDVTLSSGLVGPYFTDKSISGNYPNWRKCVATGELNPAADVCFNPELVAPFIAAIKDLRKSSKLPPLLHFWAEGGDGTKALHIVPGGIGGDYVPLMLLMPMWSGDFSKVLEIPAWAKHTEKEGEK